MNNKGKDALKVDNLSVSYHKNKIFESASCSIPMGVRCAIIGLNGAGKTTFLRSILGLEKISSGEITFAGKSFTLFHKHIAYVPQIKTIDWTFPITIENVVKMGCYQMNGFFDCILDKNADIKVESALKKMNLLDKKDEKINELSGGQKQRVFIARAIAQEPELYILDEPLSGLDIVSEKIIAQLFLEITEDNKTIIVVHHDLETLYQYFNWVIIINKGIVYCGPLEKKITEKIIERAFSR